MKRGKKILGLLLAVIMIMGFSVNALAEDDEIRGAVQITKQIVSEEVFVPETKFTYELTDPVGRDLADCGIRITRNTTSVYESVVSIVEFAVDPDKIRAENGWESSNGSDKHIFCLKEKNDGKLGWTYDDTEYIIEVIHESGTIKTRIYQGSISEGTVVDRAVFTNRYVNYATVEIPFTKTVTQDTSVAPGAQNFELEVLDVWFLQPDSYADVTCTAEVATNGAGDYNGRIVISGPVGQLQAYIDAGFVIGEKDTGASGWIYSDTVYFVKSDSESVGAFKAYPARKVVTDGVTTYEVLQQQPVDRMVFENIYTFENIAPVTVEIPFTKIVKQGGGTAPGAQDFELEILDVFNRNAENYTDVTYTAEVETNGAGHYEGKILITGPANHVQDYTCEGFAVREKNTGAENWTYSDAVYCVVPKNNSEFGFQAYPAEMTVADNGNYYEPAREPVDQMMFENIYTHDNLPPVTIEIPFTKIVKQGGNTAPGAQDFELEILDVFNSNAENYTDVTYTAKVETNGAGHYEGKILITGPANHVQEYICEGFVVREKDTRVANWTYSDAVYCVVPENDGGFEFKVYPAEMAVTDNGNYYEPARESADCMIFENTYTFTGKSNTFGPKTGDSSSLALWIIMCLASGAAAGLFISWKKRKI